MRAITGFLPAVAAAGAIAVALLLLWPTGASGQYGRPMRTTTKLTDTDLAIIRKIVREDFTGKPNGTTQDWSNPESKNSGTLTLLDRFPSKGRDCRRVRYVINPGPTKAGHPIPATYELTNCHMADGSWKLDSTAKPDAAR